MEESVLDQKVKRAQLDYWEAAHVQIERNKTQEISLFRRELSKLVSEHSGIGSWFGNNVVPRDRLGAFICWSIGEWGARLGLDVAAEVARLLEFMPDVLKLDSEPAAALDVLSEGGGG